MHLLRIVEILLKASRAHACYSTRVWTALFFPVLFGTVFRFSMRTKLEGLFVSFLIVLIYSAACFLERNYLDGNRASSRRG
jgi:uncharacterized membrane protein YwaF